MSLSFVSFKSFLSNNKKWLIPLNIFIIYSFLLLYILSFKIGFLIATLTISVLSITLLPLEYSLVTSFSLVLCAPLLKIQPSGFSFVYLGLLFLIKPIIFHWKEMFKKTFLFSFLKTTIVIVLFGLLLIFVQLFILKNIDTLYILKHIILLFAVGFLSLVVKKGFLKIDRNIVCYFFESFLLSVLCFFIISLNARTLSNYLALSNVLLRKISNMYRLAGMLGDPNIFALIGIAIYICSIYSKTCIVLKTIMKSCVSILIVLSISYTGYLALLSLIVIDLFFTLKETADNKKRKFEIISILIVFYLIIVACARLLPVLVQKGQNEDGGITSGRLDIWREYFSFFKSESPIRLLFGNGLYYNYEELLVSSFAHNFVFDIVFEIGIVGFLFYFGALFYVSRIWKADILKRVVFFIPLLIIAISTPIHFSIYGYLVFAIILFTTEKNKVESSNENCCSC